MLSDDGMSDDRVRAAEEDDRGCSKGAKLVEVSEDRLTKMVPLKWAPKEKHKQPPPKSTRLLQEKNYKK